MKDYLKPKTWLLTILMVMTAFGLSLAVVYYEFGFRPNVKVTSADSNNNVSGWAWNSNTGWISFNCTGDTPPCADSNYGVSIDANTGNFSGYAWSSSVGWISFNRSDTGNPPGQPYQNGGGSDPIAGYNSSTGTVDGWAKILSLGANGWIKLRKFPSDGGADYGVSIASGNFSGWAWNANDSGGGGIGWISFNCAGETPACSGTNYKVVANLNSSPTATNQTAPNWSYFQAGQSGALNAYLDWTFSDPDAGASESAYQIIVNTQNNTNSPFFDSGKCTALILGGKCTAGPGAGQFPLQLALSNISQSLAYNTSYYWWVEVWDNNGMTSGLTQYNVSQDTPLEADDNANKTFTTYKHEFPRPLASWFPANPSRGEEVKFIATSSQRFSSGAPATPVNCQNSTCSWLWTLPPNANFKTGYNGTASTTVIIFNGTGTNAVTLTVTDQGDTGNTSYYSQISIPININVVLPKWKEVKPE